MMTRDEARQQLIEDLMLHGESYYYREEADEKADAFLDQILPKQIATAEDLTALPDGTALIGSVNGKPEMWHMNSDIRSHPSTYLSAYGPFTIWGQTS